jgi:sortase B
LLKFWKKLNELYGWLIIAVFGFIMLIGIWQIYDNYYIYYNALDKSILRYKPDPKDPDAQKDSPITDEMVGWITIDNTNIDYPVMQGSDNSHFLNTDPFGEYSLTGSIFLDSRNSSDFTDDYSLLYGHHMEYGRMFGALDDFLDKSYLKSHCTGKLIVGKDAEKTYELEVFASMRANAGDEEVFDPGKGDIRKFIKQHSEVYTSEREGRILALSTCALNDSVSRTIVFCIIKE